MSLTNRLFGIGLFFAFFIAVPTQAIAGVKVVVDLSRQKMQVYVDGEREYTWRVSTARKGYVTPTGRFHPYWLERMHYSEKYDNAPMPYSVFFYKDYAVHGTNSIRRLGRPASHGCIRLHPSNAKKLFDLVEKHGYFHSRIVIVDRFDETLAQQEQQPFFVH